MVNLKGRVLERDLLDKGFTPMGPVREKTLPDIIRDLYSRDEKPICVQIIRAEIIKDESKGHPEYYMVYYLTEKP